MGFRVYAFTDELQFMGRGEFGHEFLIGVGFISSQLVIEVNDAEDNAQLRAKFEQNSQQRNRVRATGDCNANAVSRLQEIMLADKSQH
jgi:predicted dinucleotide-utilizing enzyme